MTIECPHCDAEIREASFIETAIMRPMLSSWGLTDSTYPHIVLCEECGWLEVLIDSIPESQKDAILKAIELARLAK